MREILFRGKRLMDGEWVDGSLFIDEKKEKHEILVGYVNYRIGWEVDPETVGQYTGLTDKNGKKIFEGDILNGLMGTMVVFFGEIIGEGYGFQWKTVSGNPRNAESMTGFVDEYEVVGNIHDNSEFLEVKP